MVNKQKPMNCFVNLFPFAPVQQKHVILILLNHRKVNICFMYSKVQHAVLTKVKKYVL